MGALIPARIANIPGLPVQLRERAMQPISDFPMDIGAFSPVQVPNVGGLRGYSIRQKHTALFAATHLSAIVGNYTGDNSLSETPGRNNVQYRVSFQKNGLPATATFSTNPAIADTLTINAVAITFVASGASGSQVNIGGSLAFTLASLVSFINANTTALKCTATATATVLTCQANDGTDGSAVAWSKSSTAITLYGTSLLGGSTGWNDTTPPRVPAFFNGSKWADVPPGGIMQSDPVAFEVAAGEAFFSLTYIGATGTQMYLPAGYTAMGGQASSGYSRCDSGCGKVNEDGIESGTFALTNATNMSGPVTILGASPSSQKIVGLFGDSICQGSGDYGAWASRGGYLERAMVGLDQVVNVFPATERTRTPNYSFVKYSRGGNTLANFVNRFNFFQGQRLLTFASTVINELGTNDLAPSNLAAMQANYLTLAAYFTARGIKFIQCTLTPRTTSTDNYLTIANQATGANETTRAVLNSWFRDTSGAGFVAQCNAPGLVSVWDVTSAIEVNSSGTLTLNGGFWPTAYLTNVVTGSITTVGGGVTYIDSAQTGMSADQYRGYYMRMTSGTANGNHNGILGNKAAGNYVLTANIAGAPVIGDTYQIYMPSTQDGTHPSTESHRRMAAYITGNSLLSQII